MAVFILETHYSSRRTWANNWSLSGYGSLVQRQAQEALKTSRQTTLRSTLFKMVVLMVSGRFANESFRQRLVRQHLRSIRQRPKWLRQRPTSQFANV